MKTNWKLIIFIIVGFIAFKADAVYSNATDGIDVVLVMDSSGSMKKTDPMSLRIPAAKLFISLLDKKDRASVVSFSDTSYPIIPLTPVDSENNKDQLLNAADKISSAGLFTNLYDALDGGLRIVSEGEKNGRLKIIVLMSDGMMDVGDTDKDRELVDKIKNQLAADLEDKGIKVYAIAFTEQSDRLLLEKISKRTGGFYNLALSDKDFHLIFTSIFESLKSPDMAPISENGFLIDGSIGEVTIVATKGAPQTQIHLKAPDGRSYSNKEKSTGIGWFASDNFDMITVKTPAEGRWEILFSTGENNKAYIITNLKLQTNFDQLYSTFGDPLDIKIWLEKDGIAIKEQELLDKFNIFIELTGPDGKALKLEPFNKGDGLFERNIAPFTPGNYKLRIIAQGNTFEREKAFVFNIADAKESKEDVLVKREKEKKAEEQIKPTPVQENSADDVSWTKVIIQFVLVNLLIGIVAFVYFKRKSIKKIKAINNITGTAKFKNLIKRKKDSGDEEEKELKKEPKTQEEQSVLHEEVKGEEELKQGVPENQEENTVLEAKEDQKELEELAVSIEQNEGEAQIKEIPLEEETTDNGQEADTGEQKQVNSDEDNNDKSNMVNDNQWREIESNQHVLNQEDLNQLLGVEGIEDSVEEKEGHGEGHDKLEKESGNQENIDNNIQTEENEDMDKLWQEALQSQKDAEAGETTNETEPEEQITDLELEIERLEKARSEEINQMPGEVTAGDENKSRKGEASEEEIDKENPQEDIDAIWQEAMVEQKASEDGRKDNKESMSDD